MAVTYRIHPAIGIARVGNSPEFFIGPERLNERPDPAGGFKDAQCRVKRQAARFRIFAHDDVASTTSEITDAEAQITWTVHLANRKAAYSGRGNTTSGAQLVIDPGARTVTGPNQQQLFDTGSIQFAGQSAVTVPLGEMRSDTHGRLVVLGGSGAAASPGGNGIVHFWGNPGWYDDIADGPVSATIVLRSNNSTPAVTAAWVITAPPKFAPHQDSPTTLYDRVLQAMVALDPALDPTQTSYSHDVYPVLQRAFDIRWVVSIPPAPHSWAHPITAPAAKQAIFNRLRPNTPNGNMPLLNSSTGDERLTPIQFAHLQRWKDGTNLVDDWTGAPPPVETSVSPAGLDRSALEACVGAAFYPGIEAGGRDASNRPILDTANYAAPFRLLATLQPGTISASMALPWQADFDACDDEWWPVPRPNEVKPQGTSTYQEWDRNLGSGGMVANWHQLGFVVRQGSAHVEVDRCDTASINLLTPALNFIDVPQGPMGMVREMSLAIVFEVSAPAAAVTLEYTSTGAPSHPQLSAGNTTASVGPTAGNSIATARLWVTYRTGSVGSVLPTQTLTVQEPTSGQTWFVTVDGNTVARKTAALALVLDRSGSMAQNRGDGMPKHQALRDAANVFVGLMLDGDGVGIVRYDHDAQVLQQVLALGSSGQGATNRAATLALIAGNGLDPAGATSIGDGIFEGRAILNNAGAYDVKALAILTDGIENSPRRIADVAPQIDERTYAVGLGTPQNTSAAALENLSGNHGGFLLITGAIVGTNAFLLQKYFLQILAGISNAEVVLDPDGELIPGVVHRIPFQLTDADSGVEVVLLSAAAPKIDFRLQTPTGLLLEPWRAASEPSMQYMAGPLHSAYRLALPAQLERDRFDQGGTWHALLRIGAPRTRKTARSEDGTDHSIVRGLFARPTLPSGRRPPSMHLVNEGRRRIDVAAADAKAAAVSSASATAASAAAAAASARRGVPYSVVVHSYSSVSLQASLQQGGWEPGATMRLLASLTQGGAPLSAASGAAIWADWKRPDGSVVTLPLADEGGGQFGASFVAATAGVHALRVRARGASRRGHVFTRERSLTAAVWRGGDRDAEVGAGGGHSLVDALGERDARLCALLRCLLGTPGSKGAVIEPGLERRLREAGFNLDDLRKCLEGYCRAAGAGGKRTSD